MPSSILKAIFLALFFVNLMPTIAMSAASSIAMSPALSVTAGALIDPDWSQEAFHQQYMLENKNLPFFGLKTPYTGGEKDLKNIMGNAIRMIRAHASDVRWEGFISPSRLSKDGMINENGVNVDFAVVEFLLKGLPSFLEEKHAQIRNKIFSDVQILLNPQGTEDDKEVGQRLLTPVERVLTLKATAWLAIKFYQEDSTRIYDINFWRNHFANQYPRMTLSETLETRSLGAVMVIERITGKEFGLNARPGIRNFSYEMYTILEEVDAHKTYSGVNGEALKTQVTTLRAAQGLENKAASQFPLYTGETEGLLLAPADSFWKRRKNAQAVAFSCGILAGVGITVGIMKFFDKRR